VTLPTLSESSRLQSVECLFIGVQRGVFKGVEDSRRPPTLWTGHPLRMFQEWLARRASKGMSWQALAVLQRVHGHPLPCADASVYVMFAFLISSVITHFRVKTMLTLWRFSADIGHSSLLQKCHSLRFIGIWCGLSKGEEDCRRPPALGVGHP
jgi:hypothetical protein